MPSSLIPTLRYRNAPGRHRLPVRRLRLPPPLVVESETEGTIAHAQLVLGSGMLMLGSARADEYESLLTAG